RFAAFVGVALLIASACGSGPAPTGASGSARPGGLPSPIGTAVPGGSTRPGATRAVAPVESSFVGALPQSTTFLGVVFTVASARVTNSHPYTMFGTPRPGPDLFGVLSVTGENRTAGDLDYRFEEEAFALRTWSGQLLPQVHRPGVGPWSNLDAGELASDEVVFGLPNVDALDGAVLLVGSGKDVRAEIPLSVAAAPPLLPAAITVGGAAGPVHAAAIDWLVDAGLATFDAPAKACCTK